MRIAVPDFVSSTMFPLIAAIELGIFKEEGEDVEIVLNRSLKADEFLRNGPLIVPPPTADPGISFGVEFGRSLAEGKVDGLWANVLGCELAVHLGRASVVVDTRRGGGPPGAGNYSFAALATTESNIETEPERIEAVIRAVVRAQSVIRQDPVRATEVTRKLFPPVEAELMGQILARDAEFYQPSISMEAIGEMNRFAIAVGLLSSPVSYEQVVATQFRDLWSE